MIQKEVTRIDKNEEEITKNLFCILQFTDRRAHYQILSTIFLKEFIKLNVNPDMMIKNVRLAELSIATVFLSIQILKMIE